MNLNKKDYQELVLQSEIAALLHDVGKFTKDFVEDATKEKESKKKKEKNDDSPDLGEIHTSYFLNTDNKMITEELASILKTQIEKKNLL